jgi:Inner membrane protein YgaP-like, transmembrane domain
MKRDSARAGILGGQFMNVERALRMVAGAFVVLSLALGYWVSPYWYLFTAFVGLNLFQSAFTNWCPMMTILKKSGMKSA